MDDWLAKDLKEQLGGAIETLTKLRERVANLKIKLVSSLDQGQGLTQDQLADLYDEINRLFPTRVRAMSKTSPETRS